MACAAHKLAFESSFKLGFGLSELILIVQRCSHLQNQILTRHPHAVERAFGRQDICLGVRVVLVVKKSEETQRFRDNCREHPQLKHGVWGRRVFRDCGNR
jgi:hypothetical protein